MTDCQRRTRSKPLDRRVDDLTARLRHAEREAYRRGVQDAIAIVHERGHRSGGSIEPEETARELFARLLTE